MGFEDTRAPRFERMALALAFLCLALHGAVPALGQEDPAAEERAVYLAALGEARPLEGRILLLASEVRRPEVPGDLEAFLEVLPGLANLPATPELEQAFRDYARADRPKALIPSGLEMAVPHSILPASEVPRPDPTLADEEARQHKLVEEWEAVVGAAGADGLTWLGPVGFSQDGSVAFTSTWTQDGPGGLSSWGGRFVLRKVDGSWEVIRRIWTIR